MAVISRALTWNCAGVLPQDAARTFQRTVQAIGRSLEHRPVEFALRRNNAPSAAIRTRTVASGLEGVRDGRQDLDGFLVEGRQR